MPTKDRREGKRGGGLRVRRPIQLRHWNRVELCPVCQPASRHARNGTRPHGPKQRQLMSSACSRNRNANTSETSAAKVWEQQDQLHLRPMPAGDLQVPRHSHGLHALRSRALLGPGRQGRGRRGRGKRQPPHQIRRGGPEHLRALRRGLRGRERHVLPGLRARATRFEGLGRRDSLSTSPPSPPLTTLSPQKAPSLYQVLQE